MCEHFYLNQNNSDLQIKHKISTLKCSRNFKCLCCNRNVTTTNNTQFCYFSDSLGCGLIQKTIKENNHCHRILILCLPHSRRIFLWEETARTSAWRTTKNCAKLPCTGCLVGIVTSLIENHLNWEKKKKQKNKKTKKHGEFIIKISSRTKDHSFDFFLVSYGSLLQNQLTNLLGCFYRIVLAE